MLRLLIPLFLLLVPNAGWTAPRRIVSLNPCLDAILVNLAHPARIAGISRYSRDPNASVISERAKRLPIADATAEGILALKPDLVLASRHTDLATRKALARFKLPVALFDTPDSIAQSHDQVRRIAALIGNPRAGERLIARIEAALAAAAPKGRPLPALIYHPSGLSPGGATLPNELLLRTGFHNMAVQYGLKGWGKVGMEAVVSRPPSVLLVAGSGEAKAASGWLSHPAMRGVRRTVRQAAVPAKLFYCGGPTLIAASRALAAIRRGQVR